MAASVVPPLTDIDNEPITVARSGLDPDSIAADLSRQRLERYFSAAPQDLELRYLWSFGAVFGVPAAEVVGRTDVELLGEDQAADVVALERRVLESGRPVRGQVRLTARGRKMTKDLVLSPLRDDAQRIIGITCIATENGHD